MSAVSMRRGPALPEPPGRLGEAAEPAVLLDFLSELEQWLDRTRGELDRLDAVAQRAQDGRDHTSDVVLAMALWQALRTRSDEILRVWDSGRADRMARDQISELIWGRLGSGALDVTLPEGSRLVDALVAQLREKLAIDPSTSEMISRLRSIRAELVRCDDLARRLGHDGLTETVTRLSDRHQRLQHQATRGADVTGPLAELEAETARAHRDLLVGTTRSGELRRDRERATELHQALMDRRPALLELQARARREVAAPPRLAVPDPARLGDPPQERAALDAYQARLDAASRALAAAEDAYAAPLRELASLRYRLAQAAEQAQAHQRDRSATVRAGRQEAADAVAQVPCEVPLARALVAQYESLAAPLDLRPPPDIVPLPIGGRP